MAQVEKVSVALTADMAAAVREAVASGEYASNSEVMREALRDWKMKRRRQQQDIEELRRLWQEGLSSGPGRFAGMEDLKAEARRRLERQSGE